MKSRHKDFSEGAFIFNTNGWQEYGLTGQDISHFNYMFPRIVDPDIAPISTALGVLGMLGLTAYSGVYLQCQPAPGETVVVSAASGGGTFKSPPQAEIALVNRWAASPWRSSPM